MDEILGVIPARGGSKGVKRKNVHPLAGKPLIQYTIEAARKCRYLSRVVVSTDDPEITGLAANMELEVLRRPDDLAHDDTPMVPVIHHVVDSLAESGYQPDDRPCFELYLNNPQEHPEGKHIVDIYAPVKPL